MSVLVTDASGNHALAAVRSLGGRGIRVTVADSARTAKGLFSRYCAARAAYPCPSTGMADFHTSLCRTLEQLRPTVLMPMTERTILALLADRNAVEARVTLPLASSTAIRTAFDKKATIALAKSLGIPVPLTFSISRARDLDEVSRLVSYPAVIKPTASEMCTPDGRIVPTGPVEYCFSPHELVAKYGVVHRRAPHPLIQEFIPGEGFGVSVLCNRGQVKALFAHRRLRMVHPTGSGSSLRESITPPPRMVDAACRLVEALEWHGVAMVEFKLDRRDAVPKLMEINGRFWNSLPLAIASGMDFPFLLYRLATEGEVPKYFDYRTGVKCRWLVGDARHLAAVLRGKPAHWVDEFPTRRETLLSFFKFLGRDLHYDDLWASDPVPFFAELADVALRQLPRFVSQRHTHRQRSPTAA